MDLAERRDVLPCIFDGMIGGAYSYIGQPERWIAWCRAPAPTRPRHRRHPRLPDFGLVHAGSGDEATAATDGLIEAADATENPFMLSFALFAYAYAFREADPRRSREAAHRGLMIAQDSGNRAYETQSRSHLGRLEAEHGDTASAFDHPVGLFATCTTR